MSQATLPRLRWPVSQSMMEERKRDGWNLNCSFDCNLKLQTATLASFSRGISKSYHGDVKSSGVSSGHSRLPWGSRNDSTRLPRNSKLSKKEQLEKETNYVIWVICHCHHCQESSMPITFYFWFGSGVLKLMLSKVLGRLWGFGRGFWEGFEKLKA